MNARTRFLVFSFWLLAMGLLFAQNSRFELFLRSTSNTAVTGATVYVVHMTTGDSLLLSEVSGKNGYYRRDNVEFGNYKIYVNGSLSTTQKFHPTDRIYLTLTGIDSDGDYLIDTDGVVRTGGIGDGQVTLPKLSSSVQALLSGSPSNAYAVDDVTLALEIDGGDTTFVVKSKGIGKSQIQDTFNVAQDTTKLKLESGLVGKQVFLKQLSTSNANGGGMYVYADSATGDTLLGVVRYKSATAGKHWVLASSIAGGGINVKEVGILGNSTDITSRLGKLEDYIQKKGGGTLYFPAGRYRLASTYQKRIGVNWIAIQGRSYSSVTGIDYNTQPYIEWGGATGDTMITISTGSSANIQHLVIQGFVFTGTQQTPVDTAGFGIVVVEPSGGGSEIDFGFDLKNNIFERLDSAAIVVEPTSTYLNIDGIRWGGVPGKAIELKQGGTLTVNNFYWDNATSGNGGSGALLYAGVDLTASPSPNRTDVSFTKGQIELHDSVLAASGKSIFYFIRDDDYKTRSVHQLTLQDIQITASPSSPGSGTWLIGSSRADTSGTDNYVSFVIINSDAPGGKIYNGTNLLTASSFINKVPFMVYAPATQTQALGSTFGLSPIQLNARTDIRELKIGANGAYMDSVLSENSGLNFYVGATTYELRNYTHMPIIGTGTILTGTQSDTIVNDLITTSSRVFVTFKTTPDSTWYATIKADSAFIWMNKAASGNKEFYYEIK